MGQGDMIKLNDKNIAMVIRVSNDYSVVALQNGCIRFINTDRDTLMYTLGELVLKCDHNIKKDYHI